MEEEKTVSVHFGERARPVRFKGAKNELHAAVCASFEDLFSPEDQFILQVPS